MTLNFMKPIFLFFLFIFLIAFPKPTLSQNNGLLVCGGDKKLVENITIVKERMKNFGGSIADAQSALNLSCESYFSQLDARNIPPEHAQECQECESSGCDISYAIDGFNNDISISNMHCWTEVSGRSWCRGDCTYKGSFSASCSPCLDFSACGKEKDVLPLGIRANAPF